MSSLVQLPPEILHLIYTELLTNDSKEFWLQLRGSNRTCFEAKRKSDEFGNNDWRYTCRSPIARPCLGEEVDHFRRYNAPSPSNVASQDSFVDYPFPDDDFRHYKAPSPSDIASRDSEVDDPLPDGEDDPVPDAVDDPVPDEDDDPFPNEVDSPLPEEDDGPFPDEVDDPLPDEDDGPFPDKVGYPFPDELVHLDEVDGAFPDEEASEDEDTHDNYDTLSMDSTITVFPHPRPFLSAGRPVRPPSQHKQCTNHYFLHPAILATNSHIHAGAAAVLYGCNAFHFALDFDDGGDGDGALSNAPWAKHLDKIRDVHLTQDRTILGRQAPPRMEKRRRNAMRDGIPDPEHWGDEEFRDDLCSIINHLLFFGSVRTQFQRLRLDLGNAVRCLNKDTAAPSTAVLFDQMAKAFARLDVVRLVDICVTARAMQLEKWTCFARNVAKSMKGQLEIIQEGLKDDVEDDEPVRPDMFYNTRFVITPQGNGEGAEVTELLNEGEKDAGVIPGDLLE